MDHSRSGKIDEALVGQPGGVVAFKQVAPGPMAKDRIDDHGNEHGAGQIAGKGHALGNSPRDDGCRGADEHGLKD
jgi:hypothetical protein